MGRESFGADVRRRRRSSSREDRYEREKGDEDDYERRGQRRNRRDESMRNRRSRHDSDDDRDYRRRNSGYRDRSKSRERRRSHGGARERNNRGIEKNKDDRRKRRRDERTSPDNERSRRFDEEDSGRRRRSHREERDETARDYRRDVREKRDEGGRKRREPYEDLPSDPDHHHREVEQEENKSFMDDEGKESKEDDAESLAVPKDPEQFVWKKKNEKLKKMGLNPEEDSETLENKKRNLQEELRKAKIRRAEREQERADWEAEQARLAREKEAEENADWENREEGFLATNFYLKQAVRLREHRPTPADYIARNTRVDLDDVAPDKRSPYDTILKVTDERLKEIVEHIEEELSHIPLYEIECEGLDGETWGEELRTEYWELLLLIANRVLTSLQDGPAAKSGVHSAVFDEVEEMLAKKNLSELRTMQQEVNDTLESGSEVDVEYWESIRERLKYYLARARADEINAALIAYKEKHSHKSKDANENEKSLQNDDEMLNIEAKKGMGENEEKFTEEVDIQRQYQWNDKYKPRKPKYFNRVHTGYEWNKYNQTHYDHDNPPPKTVQGYKFNVFYPDLINKSKAPTFKIQKTDNPDVSILRFVAGPPYEDIAFKIVNREWEHSHKKGFRCTFERGILHLWVNFKRMRYRR